MEMKFKTIEQEEFVNLVSLNEKEIQNNEKLPPKWSRNLKIDKEEKCFTFVTQNGKKYQK